MAAVDNPGPRGDFMWKGFNWTKRHGGTGGPGLAGWDRNNVVLPDGPDGPLILKMTNPSGSQPIGSEIRTTRRGFGYGTFVCVIEKDNWQDIHQDIVFGGMFSYDWNSPPGYQEMDMCETSGWGRPLTRKVETGHVLWYDADGNGLLKEAHDAPHGVRFQTHRCTWEPGKVTFESFDGVGFGGNLRKRTQFTQRVHTPKTEAIVFNLWVYNTTNHNPKTTIKNETVTIRDFSFFPRGTSVTPPTLSVPSPEPAPTPTPTPTPVPGGDGSTTSPTVVASSNYPIKGTNVAHGTNDLVIYTTAYGANTKNNKNCYEVCVRDGVVLETRDFSDAMPIQQGTVVLSAIGAARDWLLEVAPRRGATLKLPS